MSWDLGSLLVTMANMSVAEVENFGSSELIREIDEVFGPSNPELAGSLESLASMNCLVISL